MNTWKLFNKISRLIKRYFFKGTDDYSQLGEQMVILNILDRLSIHNLPTVYLDIGCYHPYLGSNTYKLYLNNWHGFVIDSNLSKIDLFKKVRPRDFCLTAAIIPDEWQMAEVEMVARGDHDGCETVTHELNNNNHLPVNLVTKRFNVKALRISETLAMVVAKVGVPSVLSLDIEGLEGDLLSNINFTKYKIPLLCIEHYLREFTESNSIFDYKHSKLVQNLELNGYILVSVCGVSLIFVHSDYYVPFS